MKICDLTFKEDTHSYFLGDLPIPSVSEIIRPIYQKVYGNINENTLNMASERGTRIHRAIEFLSKYNFCGIDTDISVVLRYKYGHEKSNKRKKKE